MIFGDPYYFSVSYDVAYPNDSTYKLGIFNFIIEDQFFPAKGGNYTISMIINYLKSDINDIKKCNPLLDKVINDEKFCTDLMHIYHPYINSEVIKNNTFNINNLPDEITVLENNDLENSVVELTPLEFEDLGYYIFYTKSETHDYIFYSYDYGQNFIKKELPYGIVKEVLDAMAPVS